MEKGKGVMGSRKWAVDFTDNSSTPSSRDIPDPPGFTRASHEQDDSTLSRQKKDAEANWKSQKAWEVAQAPFKNLLMMGFMMWMAGSTVHLFSIGITFSALWQPLSALQGVGKVFEPYKDKKVDLLAPKLLFIALNLGGMLLGVWKLNTLGLLPTHASDWVSSLPPAHEIEFSGGVSINSQIVDTFLDSVISVCLTKTEIIGGSVDGTVRTFDIRIGRELSDDLGQPVKCISLSNDGNCVLASCLDSALRLLDRTSGELLQEYKGHTCKSFKMDCCLTNSDAHIVGGSEDGRLFFWDLVDASVVSSFRAHSSVVKSVSYHPKDNCMITASVDGSVKVWKT